MRTRLIRCFSYDFLGEGPDARKDTTTISLQTKAKLEGRKARYGACCAFDRDDSRQGLICFEFIVDFIGTASWFHSEKYELEVLEAGERDFQGGTFW